MDVNDNSRLVLGTVQLGMQYGIANKNGKPDYENAKTIIETAWKGGVIEFDTAQAYGASERILGNAFKDIGITEKVKIITKLSPDINHKNYFSVRESVLKSLENLKIEKLSCVMLHRESYLEEWNSGIKEVILKLKEERLIETIGISVNHPDKAVKALESEDIDCIQLPSNILDRRFEEKEVFKKSNILNKQIYVRSVFLQGLLLIKSSELPDKVSFARSVVRKVEELAKEIDCSIIDLCLGYVKKAYPCSKIVVGVDSVSQLIDNLQLWNKEFDNGAICKVKKLFSNDLDNRILSPFMWK